MTAMAFEILPAIDLRGGRVVRLRQGDFARETEYERDPAEVASEFAVAGARWLHVVDLDGARQGAPANGSIVAAIVAAVGDRAQVEVAGGLRDAVSVAAVLAIGAGRAVVGTVALEAPARVAEFVSTHGRERIVVALDVRDGQAVGHGWTTGRGGADVQTAMERLADAGVETFEVTAIDRDGQLEGPDLELYERLVGLVHCSIIASGGIRTIDDLRALRSIGCAGAIIGRALYEGRLDLGAALTVDGPTQG